MNSCIKELTSLTLINGALHHLKELYEDDHIIIDDLIIDVKLLARFIIKDYKSKANQYNEEAQKIVNNFTNNVISDQQYDFITILLFIYTIVNDMSERVKNNNKKNMIHNLYNKIYNYIKIINEDYVDDYEKMYVVSKLSDILFTEYII